MSAQVGAAGQVRALLQLRWQMARAPGVRLAVVVGLLAAVGMLALALQVAYGLGPVELDVAVEFAPQAFLGFGVLAVIAPLTAGGGGEVVPSEQLVAFPVRSSAQFLGGLLLAPLNLVWLAQLLVLAAETACLTLGGSLLAGLMTTTAYVALTTVLGQTVAWTVVGLRRTRRGRRGVGVAAGAAVVLGLLTFRAGAHPLAVLPTDDVVRAVVAGGAYDVEVWAPVTAGIVATTGLLGLLGAQACAWALSRPEERAPRRAVRGRRPRHTVLGELVAVDRASVWRAPALRRGGLVLALLPALLAAGTQVSWASLAVLPGLVAAGTGLLFGINVFTLDGAGALWLASLPVAPRLVALAKLAVLTETVLASALLTVLAGAVASPGTPTPAEAVAVAGGAVASTAVIVVTAFARSLRSPHRAVLDGPRDTVAPPGALAVASLQLTVPTTVAGLLLVAAGQSGRWPVPLVASLVVLALAARQLRRDLARWDDPRARAVVVQVVASG